MDLIEMENKVQFADVLEGTIECFYEHLDQIQYSEFALCAVDDENKVKCSIISVHDSPPFIRAILGAQECLEFGCI